MRLNGEDLNSEGSFTARFSSERSDLVFERPGGNLSTADVDVVWFRRWHRLENFDIAGQIGDLNLAFRVEAHMRKELGVTFGGMCALLQNAEWLTRPHEVRLNKLGALMAASRVGFDIPETLLTTSKAEVQRLKEKHQRIISKTIGEVSALPAGSSSYVMHTVEVTQEALDRAPDSFFPSLVQELLDKAYELRVFFLDGKCYPMAIFSQLDQQTEIDFRHYNHSRPNRGVPYRLPNEAVDRIRSLMADLDMTTASLDLVRTRDGRYVFLEINPAGQFGMVSYPCNYRLEKAVAESLIRRRSHA